MAKTRNENISLGHWGKYDFRNYYKKEAIEKKQKTMLEVQKKKRKKKRQFQNIGLIIAYYILKIIRIQNKRIDYGNSRGRN